MADGKIVKAIAGFYYVYVAESGIYKCRAKGIFRKDGTKPLVGDDVTISVTHEKDMEGNVEKIFPRRNEMERPAAANVDQVLIMCALRHPAPNFTVIDRFLISASMRGIPCVIGVNKTDLAKEGETEEIRHVYEHCGSPVVFFSVKTGTGMDELMERLKGRTTILAGPSGAGKSSLVNTAAGKNLMETGEISRKLSRGKNTTRHTELLKIAEGTYLCDTPGFTAFDTADLEKEKLQDYYAEFAPYREFCRFQGCVHVDEPECAVKTALLEGHISDRRYGSYVQLFRELKEAERRRYS